MGLRGTGFFKIDEFTPSNLLQHQLPALRPPRDGNPCSRKTATRSQSGSAPRYLRRTKGAPEPNRPADGRKRPKGGKRAIRREYWALIDCPGKPMQAGYFHFSTRSIPAISIESIKGAVAFSSADTLSEVFRKAGSREAPSGNSRGRHSKNVICQDLTHSFCKMPRFKR
jgi:hypothetical protein